MACELHPIKLSLKAGKIDIYACMCIYHIHSFLYLIKSLWKESQEIDSIRRRKLGG